MTPSDLTAWLSRVGWSQREACRRLGISTDRWQRMIEGGRIPSHIALACAALAAELPAWSAAQE